MGNGRQSWHPYGELDVARSSSDSERYLSRLFRAIQGNLTTYAEVALMSRRQDKYPLDTKVQQIVVRSLHALFPSHPECDLQDWLELPFEARPRLLTGKSLRVLHTPV